MSMPRTLGMLAAAAALVAAPPALAQDGSRQTATLELTKKRPNVSSGLELRIDYINPADPSAKPPAVRQVVERLARGARIDTSAPGLCTATDLELMALGAGACPANSVVGSGVIVIDTGLPEPGRFLTSDVTFLNNAGELIFLTSTRPVGARLVVRAQQGEREAVSEAPFLPGTPPDGAAIDTVSASFPRLVTERGSYITTPPRCPPRRSWRNKVRFEYYDGVTQTVTTKQRCKRPR
jgi:hypothetical protein